MDYYKLFGDFSSLLATRTTLLTEDSVRYCFFAAMLQQDPQLDNYVLEVPYNDFSPKSSYPVCVRDNSLLAQKANQGFNQELDLLHYDTQECLCVEFKFHRQGSKRSSLDKTKLAGSVFNDVRRLSEIVSSNTKRVLRLLVYVTDDIMDSYFNNCARKRKANYGTILKSFYNANSAFKQFIHKVDVEETFWAAASDSFKNQTSPFSLAVNKSFGADFPSNNPCITKNLHIRVFEISSFDNPVFIIPDIHAH